MDAPRQQLDSPEGLAWVRSRVSADPTVSRCRLAREVCEHFGWRDPLGRPQEMACRKHLLQLERRGLIQLPPARRARPQRPRAAPFKAPHFSGALADLGTIELRAVSGGTAASQRWNGMMEAHHPQGSGPLCGAQIRYLIVSQRLGEIGGLAISAPAWRLAARDQWLGWSDATRAHNLSSIVCNSRFLILPTVTVKHLASKVLGLLARRIVADWRQRYGFSPWLMETCVEVERSGTCYKAANWIEVGLTAGRGRQDRDHKRDVKRKRVFLYPMCKATLVRLCGERPAPEPDWVNREFGGAKLGDRRLQKRLFELAASFFARSTANIPQAVSAAAAKAAYRFFDHERTTLEALIEPHRRATLDRLRHEPIVLVVRDTLSLDFTTHRAMHGIGPLTTEADGPLGLILHYALAFRPDGLPLGILDTASLGRKNKTARQDREDDAWAPIREAQHRCPKTRFITVGDCEGDIFAVLQYALQQKGDLLIRVRENEAQRLWPQMQSLAEAGDIALLLEGQNERVARTARVDVRFAAIALAAKPDLPLWAVWARERDADEGIEPIEWKLLTTVAVNTVGDALERVKWYLRRSGSEAFHHILKNGCRVEDRQLRAAGRLEACLAIDMVVAWHMHTLAFLDRTTAEMSDAKREVPAPRIAHRRAPDRQSLHRAHGA
jgi:hypothetical protein